MANFNKSKKYHFIYKTMCLLNDTYYIGMHSTNNLNDGYLGSGKRLRYSIRKYGEDNFKLEILEFLSDRESLVEREMELVNEDLLRDERCLNLKEGGIGGFISEEQQRRRAIAGGKASAKKIKNDTEYRERVIQNAIVNFKKAHKEGKIKYDTFTNKQHTEKTKRMISDSLKGKGRGKSNSQYGTCWITNEIENKKIKKGSVIPENWRLGRVTVKN